MGKLYLILFTFIAVLSSQIEFSEGPYGTGYFETAGSFTVVDLNSNLGGDVNADDSINIQDIIRIIGYILGTIAFTEDELERADVNNDGSINVQDIVLVVNNILYPQQGTWNFEWNWTGEDIYIFLHQHSAVPSSNSMWNSNTKQSLLESSPDNVHYFFISSETNYITQINNMKDEFDEVLENFSDEDKAHWNNHLHFIPEKGIQLDNWLATTLNGNYAFAIDGFQKIRQMGYLGNPASFSGTYLSYIAHEAVYLDYELNTFAETEQAYDEITIFDEEVYTGYWGVVTTKIVELPSDANLANYTKMEVDLLRGCPDGNGGYDDDNCDDYDRIAHLYMCEGQCYETLIHWALDETSCSDGGYTWNNEDGICTSIQYLDNISQDECGPDNWNFDRDCNEIARWITPFDRQPHHLTDISPFISTLIPGGNKMFKFRESGWPNSLLTLKLRLYDEPNVEETPREFIPMWSGTVQFNPDYSNNRPLLEFSIPDNVSKVEFVAYITGHGWGSAGCFNCAEFCNHKHIFTINGGPYEFDTSFPNASSNNYCMQLGSISTGVIPNQYGTWGYGRAGWCPGLDVKPFVTDITTYLELGGENFLEYDACRVSGTSCVTPPVCAGDGYCPEIAFSSYIILYY